MQIPMRVRSALLSLVSVTVVTGAIYALRPVAPVLSLGVLYLFAVLPAAALLGLRYAVGVSVVSMLTFNFLFLAPRHTFRLADSENWVALAVYLVTAVSVSELAARARRRASEAEKLAREASEAAALRRSDAAKTAVLRSVSHDLRSPITAIMTASDVLESSRETSRPTSGRSSTPPFASRLSGSTVSSRTCSTCRASRRAQPCPRRALDRRRADRTGTRGDRARERTRGRRASRRVAARSRRRGSARARLRQPARERAQVLVAPRSHRVASRDENGEVVVRITDHGPGIPAQEREWLFEPFARGANGDSGSGTGLGLAIARGFTQLNGGRLWIETGANNGTTFALALPVADVPSIAAT